VSVSKAISGKGVLFGSVCPNDCFELGILEIILTLTNF
jgi:hypothetical protein